MLTIKNSKNKLNELDKGNSIINISSKDKMHNIVIIVHWLSLDNRFLCQLDFVDLGLVVSNNQCGISIIHLFSMS